jgi:hypothetical protein
VFREVPKPEFYSFGLDAELAQKAKEKYSPELEKEARDWIKVSFCAD